MRALVTGANGFIGTELCRVLMERGVFVRGALRNAETQTPVSDRCIVGEISGSTDWGSCLDGIDVVFHLAGRAHIGGRQSRIAADYQRVNVDATLALARAAAARGVEAFVFLSSAKVAGDSDRGRPFIESDPPNPQDVYAESKAAAERLLGDLAQRTKMRIIIVRPPLVYGPGVKANFFNLMRAVNLGLPLPLGAIANARTLVYAGNLVDALIALVANPDVRGTFFVSDGEDVSTPELVRRIAAALGRSPRLLAVPLSVLRKAGAVLGKGSAIDRLAGSLRVDTSRIRDVAAWKPPYTMIDGLRETAAWYRRRKA